MIGYRPTLRMSVVAIAVTLLVSCAHDQSPESMAHALDAYIWFTQDDDDRHLHWNRVFEPPSTWTRVAD